MTPANGVQWSKSLLVKVLDMAGVIPVGKGAGYDGEEHVIGAVDVDDLRRPERIVRRGEGYVCLGDVLPVRSSIGGFGNTDARAMHPGDSGIVVEVGAPVGVKHPPGFAGAIPDHDGIGCTVMDRVAEKWDGCGPTGLLSVVRSLGLYR